MLLALEIGFEGRDQQTLPEASWTAQEIYLVGVSHLVNQLRLVYVHAIIIAQIFKILNPDGKASVGFFHNLAHLFCKNKNFQSNNIILFKVFTFAFITLVIRQKDYKPLLLTDQSNLAEQVLFVSPLLLH